VIPGRSYDRVDAGTPAPLRRLQAYLNTLDERSFERLGARHRHEDLLQTPADLRQWLREQGVSTRVTSNELEQARQLRAALRELLAHRAGLSADLEAANQTLAAYPLLLRADDGACRLAGPGSGVAAVLGELVATAAIASADGSLGRLRMCGASDCRWVFYDASRGGRGRWCSMEPCGNRAKTRAYRQRRGRPDGALSRS
jgi:predicted RNA-binding Zn ribbon-like protein